MPSKTPAPSLILVEPNHFAFNEQTSTSNSFQKNRDMELQVVRRKALEEFNTLLQELEKRAIDFKIFPSVEGQTTPDAVFPNNWISMHADGTLVLYPMQANNRRLERNSEIVNYLKSNYTVSRVIDLSSYENQGLFLEGTGSIVFDHDTKIAYCCRSPRSSEALLQKLCDSIAYTYTIFSAYDAKGEEIYHTNVMMHIGSNYVVVCFEAVDDALERSFLKAQLEQSGKTIYTISFQQMLNFAGNMLEVTATNGKSYLLMSQTAYDSLQPQQLENLSQHCELVPVAIPTIEQIGGGSIRCMLAGNHLPKLQ